MSWIIAFFRVTKRNIEAFRIDVLKEWAKIELKRRVNPKKDLLNRVMNCSPSEKKWELIAQALTEAKAEQREIDAKIASNHTNQANCTCGYHIERAIRREAK